MIDDVALDTAYGMICKKADVLDFLENVLLSLNVLWQWRWYTNKDSLDFRNSSKQCLPCGKRANLATIFDLMFRWYALDEFLALLYAATISISYFNYVFEERFENPFYKMSFDEILVELDLLGA